jgi:hypothetical protein
VSSCVILDLPLWDLGVVGVEVESGVILSSLRKMSPEDMSISLGRVKVGSRAKICAFKIALLGLGVK